MRFSVQCLVVVCLLLSIDLGLTQSRPNDTPPVRIYVDVDAKSPSVIKSGLLKRLRQFREVEIEDENERAFYSIFVQVLELSPFGLRTYVLSVVYTKRSLSFESLSGMYHTEVAKTEAEKKDAELYMQESEHTRVYMGQSLHSCAEAQLGQTLDEIVADIDSGIIEPERQAAQRAEQLIEEEKRRKAETSPSH